MSTTTTQATPEPAQRSRFLRWRQRAPARWFRHPVRAVVLAATLTALGLAGWWGGRQLWTNHLWEKAEIAIADYDFLTARGYLEQYLQIRPGDAAGHFMLARTCRRMQDYVTWDEQIQKCQKLRYDRAALELEQLLTRVQSGELRSSESRVLALLEEIHPQEVLILEALVKGYLQAHRLREAHRWATIWFERHPHDIQPLLWRGLSSEMARYYASAINDYRKALEIQPEKAAVHVRLADALFVEGQYQEAVEHYERFEQLEPEAGDSLVRQAQCYRSLGNQAAARAALDRLFALTEFNPGGLLLRAQLELDEEKPEEALAWLRKAEQLAPHETDIVHSLALVLRRLERDEEAAKYEGKLRDLRTTLERLEMVQREIMTKPDDVGLRLEAGKLLLGVAREREALRWLVSVRQMNPGYLPVHAAFAEYYERVGKPALAAYHRRIAGGRERPPETSIAP